MNKYDQKVMQFAKEGSSIFELIPKKRQGTGIKIVDILLDNVLSLGPAVSQLERRESFYLVMDEQKAELVTIQKDLNLAHKDISNSVSISSGKKHFDFDGYQYKLFRKVK
ncbi:hypothetical protein [Paucisalibacillus globulus]|uniref:hypothetical protein n=1 Tax=Paucisalibacillus globulus TaxID=351095 RepID=UPI000BB98C0C|nr:hypothetical protein [Paucisalibacillus globulus]